MADEQKKTFTLEEVQQLMAAVAKPDNADSMSKFSQDVIANATNLATQFLGERIKQANIVNYHAGNFAEADAHYKSKLLGLDKEYTKSIAPYPPVKSESLAFAAPATERKEEKREEVAKKPPATKPQPLPGKEPEQRSWLSKYGIPAAIVGGSLLLGGRVGYFLSRDTDTPIEPISGQSSITVE